MISAAEAKVEILVDPAALAIRDADWMLELAMATDGSFSVALSGGSTPQGLYVSPGHLTSMPSLGLAPTGSGATSALCPTTTH